MHTVSDPQLCRQCGGRCCQGHPGLYSDPVRFMALFCAGRALPAEQLARQLAPLQLELRELDGVAIPAPRGSERGCVFLAPDGCRLPEARRPDQCLALIPQLETLLDDALHCRLPSAQGSGRARQRWAAHWRRLVPKETP